MKAVSIIGLGWLGLPLADLFIQKGYSVAGTTTCAEKLAKIRNTSLTVNQFNLYADLPDSLPEDYFKDSALVLNIPPGRKNFQSQEYRSKMLALIDYAMQAQLKQIVFISTTSVYGDTRGTINNNTPLAPLTESAKAHVAIERHLMSHYPERACVIRPSGLVGPNHSLTNLAQDYRHPIYSLSKKEYLDSGTNPVNLVHQSDLLTAIAVAVDKGIVDTRLNLSSTSHSSRREYYTWCAKQLNLPAPNFSNEVDKSDENDKNKSQLGKTSSAAPSYKVIDASDSLETLGICLAYPSPFDMLPA